jgi:hypothetical protein
MEEWTIQLKVELPSGLTKQDVTEWAAFNTGYNCSLSHDNPLCNTELEAVRCWVDK